MLQHKGTKRIETERLTLRPFRPEDAGAMFENWAGDARVTRYLTWEPHESREATRRLLVQWCAAYENPRVYQWAMDCRGQVIGSLRVVRLSDESEYAELGYCMGYAYWNQGLMTEAVKAVIDYLFSEVGLHRVGISHAVKNPASGRVAQKCGLSFEGTKRQYFKSRSGEFLDISDYGILRSEWGR